MTPEEAYAELDSVFATTPEHLQVEKIRVILGHMVSRGNDATRELEATERILRHARDSHQKEMESMKAAYVKSIGEFSAALSKLNFLCESTHPYYWETDIRTDVRALIESASRRKG